MVGSDHSETEEGDMDKLQLSSDSIDGILPRKRLRVENSEDDAELPAKKRQISSFDEQSIMIKDDNAEIISDKNNIDECNVKKEKYTLCPENEQTVQATSLNKSESDTDRENKEKRGDNVKRDNGNESPLDENNIALNNSPGERNVKKEIIENEDSPAQKPATNTHVMSILESKKVRMEGNKVDKEEIDETIDEKEDSEKDEMGKQHTGKRRTVDTEVVDGLELSVEYASDKDDSSSESENEKDANPRPKTIIVKAEPNESELDCSSDREKSDSQRVLADTLKIKSEKTRGKRRDSRTSFSKLKVSDSEDSQNSTSDEDYSPRTKKKMKKSSPTAKKSSNKHRLVESKKGRGRGMRGTSHKKNTQCTSDEDEDVTEAERADETTKAKNGIEEELSGKESSNKDESDNSEREERSMKGRRGRRSNAKPQDRHIQALKKYLSVAGVRVKCYNDIWADCKSNAAKIKRLKELLEKNGVSGRPTLEKCKRAREIREESELDTSNIISEGKYYKGRVTRARRNMENVKKTPPDTPPRHREARNTFRRIQSVVDSDSE
ncbi:nucleolar protein dnt1-like isoform X1 [Temnothorax curvispinosus]|uniref:Nucleolar protein dnt1-like isoform X1 n=1 Tax=Temnothorax curvispinosus TaxID=300111 RepID=A0A6J1QV29_9HYME|nr:nucleolar protein dnt1-like isoform X1 [Temnothorax curvispinosus]XP_024885723.1 nucleolar protein dnt1-like isoform X1 [Temnothorax curvispinosus]